jgi:hypothetical protein
MANYFSCSQTCKCMFWNTGDTGMKFGMFRILKIFKNFVWHLFMCIEEYQCSNVKIMLMELLKTMSLSGNIIFYVNIQLENVCVNWSIEPALQMSSF